MYKYFNTNIISTNNLIIDGYRFEQLDMASELDYQELIPLDADFRRVFNTSELIEGNGIYTLKQSPIEENMRKLVINSSGGNGRLFVDVYDGNGLNPIYPVREVHEHIILESSDGLSFLPEILKGELVTQSGPMFEFNGDSLYNKSAISFTIPTNTGTYSMKISGTTTSTMFGIGMVNLSANVIPNITNITNYGNQVASTNTAVDYEILIDTNNLTYTIMKDGDVWSRYTYESTSDKLLIYTAETSSYSLIVSVKGVSNYGALSSTVPGFTEVSHTSYTENYPLTASRGDKETYFTLSSTHADINGDIILDISKIYKFRLSFPLDTVAPSINIGGKTIKFYEGYSAWISENIVQGLNIDYSTIEEYSEFIDTSTAGSTESFIKSVSDRIDDIYYLSPTGDDSNSGTRESPFLTLSNVPSYCGVVFLEGSYSGLITIDGYHSVSRCLYSSSVKDSLFMYGEGDVIIDRPLGVPRDNPVLTYVHNQCTLCNVTINRGYINSSNYSVSLSRGAYKSVYDNVTFNISGEYSYNYHNGSTWTHAPSYNNCTINGGTLLSNYTGYHYINQDSQFAESFTLKDIDISKVNMGYYYKIVTPYDIEINNEPFTERLMDSDGIYTYYIPVEGVYLYNILDESRTHTLSLYRFPTDRGITINIGDYEGDIDFEESFEDDNSHSVVLHDEALAVKIMQITNSNTPPTMQISQNNYNNDEYDYVIDKLLNGSDFELFEDRANLLDDSSFRITSTSGVIDVDNMFNNDTLDMSSYTTISLNGYVMIEVDKPCSIWGMAALKSNHELGYITWYDGVFPHNYDRIEYNKFCKLATFDKPGTYKVMASYLTLYFTKWYLLEDRKEDYADYVDTVEVDTGVYKHTFNFQGLSTLDITAHSNYNGLIDVSPEGTLYLNKDVLYAKKYQDGIFISYDGSIVFDTIYKGFNIIPVDTNIIRLEEDSNGNIYVQDENFYISKVVENELIPFYQAGDEFVIDSDDALITRYNILDSTGDVISLTNDRYPLVYNGGRKLSNTKLINGVLITSIDNYLYETGGDVLYELFVGHTITHFEADADGIIHFKVDGEDKLYNVSGRYIINLPVNTDYTIMTDYDLFLVDTFKNIKKKNINRRYDVMCNTPIVTLKSDGVKSLEVDIFVEEDL